jgi:hypothetical protein
MPKLRIRNEENTAWLEFWSPEIIPLNGLVDVNEEGLREGDVLVWNASGSSGNWEPERGNESEVNRLWFGR